MVGVECDDEVGSGDVMMRLVLAYESIELLVQCTN